MANAALTNLATKIKTDAAAGPITLTQAYLIAGLNDSSITVPNSINGNLKAAFQSGEDGLTVTVQADKVGTPSDDSFDVTAVSAKFIGTQVDQGLTLTFSLTGAAGSQTLVLVILTKPASWSWSDLSSIATGFPFDLTSISGAQFTFSSEVGPEQAFLAQLTPPEQFKPVVTILQGLGFPAAALPFKGVMDFSQVDGDKVLLPTTEIAAPFSSTPGSYTLLFLTVSDPVFGLEIGPPELQSDGDSEDDFYDQYIALYFGVNLQVEDNSSNKVIYQLRSYAAFSPGGQASQAGDSYPFNFTLGPASNSDALLTPATVISVLTDSKGSFFQGTPPQLQQFLTGVGLRGFSLYGVYDKTPQLQNTAVALGADPNVINESHPWTPFEDPTNGLNFGITDFELDWSLARISAKETQQSYLFQTSFVLLPKVFQATPPNQNGLFEIQFGSNMVLNASFDGTASLNELIATLSANLIAIPESFVSVTVSNVQLTIDVSAKSYQFSTDFEVDVNLFTIGGNPALAISDGQLAFGAVTPAASGTNTKSLVTAPGTDTPQTTYSASISGFVGIGPVFANASLDYEGTGSDKTWKVSAHLAQPVDVEVVVAQFLSFGGDFTFPSFLPGTLLITDLGIDATVQTGTTAQSSYTLVGAFDWTFSLGQAFQVDTQAKIALDYDGAKEAAQQYSCDVATLWDFSFLNDTVLLGYSLKPDNDGSNAILTMTWAGLTATYAIDKEQLTFTLSNWSLGKLIQKLVQTLGNPYFTLDAPWDVLNQISLDGLSLIINLKDSSGKSSPSISAKYTLPAPVDLGFIKINGLVFSRQDVNGQQKINLAIDGSSVLQSISSGSDQQSWDNLLSPDKGQPVDKLPTVPGRGNEYFNLPLLALGQRIAINGYQSFDNTKAVIDALANVPATTGDSNPVNPGASGGAKGTPYYDRNAGWLIAGHLQLLKAGNDWTVDLMLVFNDPNLYGARLAAAGEKAKALQGLVLDILYKKITDDVGVYQIDWTFPDSIRNLNFGAVSIVLPSIGVKIYTNGDFFIDIGFPYNMDFSRSFSFSAIIYGVPVLGSGGVYFGKLSAVTATQVPATTKGTFDPVITFGLGMQVGLGYNFSMGPLKAGFALTVFGILEGTIATFHAYQISSGSSNTPVQNDYYFYIKGTVGVLGKLYGSVDFGIISASLTVKITLSLSVTYESYQPIPIAVRVTVDVSLKVKVDLGLFSFSISLSFHADVSAHFDIALPNQGTAPWADGTDRIAARSRPLLTNAMLMDFAVMPLGDVSFVRKTAASPELNLYVTPQFTVMANEGETDYTRQYGAFVFLLSMDAPSASGDKGTGDTSLDRLCKDYFNWLLGKLNVRSTTNNTLAELQGATVSKAKLQAGFERLADPANPPFTMTDLLTFLSSFNITITIPDSANQAEVKDILNAGAMIFPAFDGLNLAVPQSGDPSKNASINFQEYATANQQYLDTVASLFEQLAAVVSTESSGPTVRALASAAASESLAAMIFVDTFMMIGRQLFQVGLNAFDDYAYDLSQGSSIESILTWANSDRGNDLTVEEIIAPNAKFPLTGGVTLTLPIRPYTLQQGDTLDTVAASYTDSTTGPRWQTTAQQLIEANGDTPALKPGVAVTLTIGQNPPQTVPVVLGMTFNGLATAFNVDLATLAAQSALYSMTDLLRQGTPLIVPPLSYQTAASGDTLQSVSGNFGLAVADLFPAALDLNQKVALFDVNANGIFALTSLTELESSDIQAVVDSTDQVSQISGMVSRFLLYGLRLPGTGGNTTGLSLSDQFLYPTTQSSYSLYQLTGQQFPTPTSVANGSDYSVSLNRADSSHGVDLSFITIGSGSSGSMVLTTAYDTLSSILGYAQQGVFKPEPQFALEPGALRSPNALAVKSYSRWASADVGRLQALCQDSKRSTSGSQPQVQPILWSLPGNLTQLLNQRMGVLQQVLNGFSAIQPYMPAYAPYVIATDAATHLTTKTAVASYCYATRIDFTVKKLPQAVLQDAQSPVNPLVAMSYEVIAPSATEALALEQLLTAISEIGTGIVQDLFLLMPQGNAKATNLLSQAQSDFIAFLTQTNLSTETNPPPVQAAPMLMAEVPTAPRGILNPVDEFVQLLWELATVRSGGYYLSYQDLVSGTGLPDAIFDDSGSAVLTLVIAYDSSASGLNGRLANFVNAFFTTDTVLQQGNSLSLLSQSAALDSQPTGSDDSLVTLSAFYGFGVGRLAELNPTQALREDAVIPIQGVVHLITLAEAAAANQSANQILDNLAAYYSVNAVNALQGSDIASINPGVTAAAGVALFIPSVEYKVSSTAAPGNTFSDLTAYYGINIDTLAVDTATVTGIFPDKTVLNIDIQTFDSRSTFGQGNAGFTLTREAPDFPETPGSDPQGYATAYLYNLYSVLAAGVDASFMFELTDLVVPFGPQKPDDDSHQTAMEMRDPVKRRQRLTELADTTEQTYQHAMGLSRRAKTNAAPVSPSAGLPAAADNPYTGVGSFAQLDLSWRDLFGNTTVTPFVSPSSDYSGALNGQPMIMSYTDRPIGLDSWPQLKSCYTYQKTNDQISLLINLNLDTLIYTSGTEGSKVQAVRDLGVYQTLYFQLNQSYKDLQLPWADANPMTVSLTHTLTGATPMPLSQDQWQPLRDYIAGVIIYLEQIVAGNTPKPPAQQTLSVAISIDDMQSGNILSLSVMLTLTRASLLVAPSVAGVAGGLSVSSSILPQPDSPTEAASSGPSGYTEFAKTFEGTFLQEGEWSTRVGTGTANPGATPDGRSQTLWAVRFAEADGQQGIAYSLGVTPGYFAPKPIARTLTSAKVQIYPTYNPDQSFPPPGATRQTLEFAGVDQNVWFESVLKAIDDFLSPGQTPAVFLLDQLLGTRDPTQDGLLGKVLTAKKTLADAISITVTPVLSAGPQGGMAQAAATEKLHQSLLNELASAYSVTAAVGIDATVSSVGQSITLYGQPVVTSNAGQEVDLSNQNYSFTTGRIPFAKGSNDSSLGFLFNSKNEKDKTYVSLGLTYKITHLEHDITSVPGIEGYIQSNWISLISGPIDVPLAGGQVLNLPVVLRALPEPPTLLTQTASPSNDQPKTVGELAQWNYGFGYTYVRSGQDSVKVTVEINGPDVGQEVEEDASGGLITALAQFVTVFPEVSRAVSIQLAQISGNNPNADNIALAEKAVSAFVYLVEQVTSAYDAWARPPMMAAAFVAPQPMTLDFTLALIPVSVSGSDEPVAQTDLLEVTITNSQGSAVASYDMASQSISATIGGTNIVLPAPIVQILPDSYQAVAVQPTAPALVSYRYEVIETAQGDSAVKGPSYLTYSAALDEAQRQILLPKLDVFSRQSLWSSLVVERNLILFPESEIGKVQTNQAFLFSTPKVRFADSISPEILYEAFSLDNLTPTDQTVAGYLTEFFNQLGAQSDDTSVQISMEGNYAYSLNGIAGLSRTVLPVVLMLPQTSSINGAPPFVDGLAQAVDTWRINNSVTYDGNATVDFALKIFSADDTASVSTQDNQPPIFSINNLSLSAANAPPVKPKDKK